VIGAQSHALRHSGQQICQPTQLKCTRYYSLKQGIGGMSMSKLNQFKPGQHLKVSSGLYSHHGIYVGKGRVVHYAGKSNGLFDDSCSFVQETALAQFAGQRTVYRVSEPDAKFAADEIVRRAKSRLGENRYSVITNNCEHFVSWCIHGEHSSEQVQRAGVVVAAAAASAGAVRVYRASKTTSTVVNAVRLAAASSSSSQAGLLVSAASGGGAAGATAALTAGGSVAGGSAATGLVATGSTLLATPAAPIAAAALVTGGLVYGVGKLFDWW
jgi:hypothetical protein